MCQINPMSEIRAIAEACRRECLPAGARLLWRVLFDCANDRQKWNAATNAYDWPDDFFPIDNAELVLNCAMEKCALLEARNRLKQIGVIDFRPGENNRRPAKYKILYLTACRCKFAPAQVPADVPAQAPAQAPAGVQAHVPQCVPIYHKDKDKETDQNKNGIDDDDDEDDVLTRAREAAARQAFRQAFGKDAFPSQVELIALQGKICRMGPEKIARAIHVAAAHGARDPLSYAVSVMIEWRREGVQTPEQADEYQAMNDRHAGRGGMITSGDPAMDAREAWEARARRMDENALAAVGSG